MKKKLLLLLSVACVCCLSVALLVGCDNNNDTKQVMVCGILSIVAALISPLIAFILGGIAIVYGNKDKKTFGLEGYSKAGYICGIVGIALGLVVWLGSVALMMSSGYYF